MPGGKDFFISYTSVNRSWAEWIAVELERARYTTVLQAWDFGPGTDFVHKMQEAASTSSRTLAVLSPAYLSSPFSESEWRAAFKKDPSGDLGHLLPVRVQACDPPGLLASRVYVDLVDIEDEAEARRRLLSGAAFDPGVRPTSADFPNAPAPRPARFPGLGPALCNLRARNRNFSGRDTALSRLAAELRAGAAGLTPAMVAIHGMGGIGKTQLALEYAHRFASNYDIVWWIPADRPTSASEAIASLADRLELPDGANQAELTAVVLDTLRDRDRWLLVFDNAERPDSVDGLLPARGNGHVLITSRWSTWAAHATPIEMHVLTRDESVMLLSRRISDDDVSTIAQLDALADLLGDLPLALEEAAAYLDETKERVGDYLDLVRARAAELFGLADRLAERSDVIDAERDRRRVATIWSVSLDRVRTEAPGADRTLALLAFLAPDVPRRVLTDHAQSLAEPLDRILGDRISFNEIMKVIGRYSLATLTSETISTHPLVQAVIRAKLGHDRERATAALAVTLVHNAFPGNVSDIDQWSTCATLLPQVLAVADHAERLSVADEQLGWLLERASAYLRERAQYQQAGPLAERAIAITRRALGRHHPEVAHHHDELGRVRQDLGDLDGAREHHEHALRIGQAALGPDHADVGVWRNNLGNVLHDLGDLAAAREQYERALEIGEIVLGPDHPDVGIRRNNLGVVLHDQGDLHAAREQYEHALRISLAVFGPDHPTVGTRRANLGTVLRDLGDLQGALTHQEHALAISEASLGRDHPTVATRRANLGMLLRDLGRLDDARRELEQALRIGVTALGEDHSLVGTWHNNLGNVLQDLGDLSGARDRYQQALRITEAVLGAHHHTVAVLRNNLAIVLQALGHLTEARELLELLVPENPDNID